MKKNHIITLAIVLGSLVIGGTSLGIFLIIQPPDHPPSDCETIQASGDYFLPSTAFDSTKLEVINKMENFDIMFNLLPEDSEHILIATWEVKYLNWSIPDDFQFELEITGEEVDDFLVISLDFENETRPTWVTESSVSISINPMYAEYKFSSVGEEGHLDVVFDTKRELVFSKMEASTTGGDIYIQLNHTILNCGIDLESIQGDIKLFLDLLPITGAIECRSLLGNVNLDFWDIILSDNQSITGIASKGTTAFRWAQHTQKFHQANIILEAYYNCYLYIWCPIEIIRYDAASEAPEGRCDFMGHVSDEWVEIEPDRYRSVDFNETLDFFQASTKSYNFSTYTHLNNCFKPRRYCGASYSEKSNIYEILESGEYSIPTENYAGSDIRLSDYTAYANTTLNISALDANSTNVVEATWNLAYYQGRNAGFGLLQIDFSYEIIENVLLLSLKLEYEPDRIRPVYTAGEINIKIHPDYIFSLFSET